MKNYFQLIDVTELKMCGRCVTVQGTAPPPPSDDDIDLMVGSKLKLLAA